MTLQGHIVTSIFGKELLVVNNYKFDFHKALKNGVARWRCNQRSCKSSIKTASKYDLRMVEFQDCHDHEPEDASEILRKDVQNKLKMKVVEEGIREIPSKFIRSNLKATADYFSKRDILNMEQVIRRQRKLIQIASTNEKRREASGPTGVSTEGGQDHPRQAHNKKFHRNSQEGSIDEDGREEEDVDMEVCEQKYAAALGSAGEDRKQRWAELGGPSDAGPSEAGPSEAGPSDAGPSDAGPSNAGPSCQPGIRVKSEVFLRGGPLPDQPLLAAVKQEPEDLPDLPDLMRDKSTQTAADEDQAFLDSLRPLMKRLSIADKSMVKAQIQQLFVWKLNSSA